MGGKHSGSRGDWATKRVFIYRKLDEDGTLNYFETDQAKIDTPTLLFNTLNVPQSMVEGFINRIHYRLNPTNAVTFTLRIWEAAVANNYESNMNMLWESPALQADDTDYDIAELNIPFRLAWMGAMFYSIDWTGASGDTTGFIELSGESVR